MCEGCPTAVVTRILMGIVLAIASTAGARPGQTPCPGKPTTVGAVPAMVLTVGGLAARARLEINIDGSGRAYNWDNSKGLIHLCNGARVFLPDGSMYEGSQSNAICTGQFMQDVARIKAAGWTSGQLGAVQWYGVAATGSAVVNGRTIQNVVPAEIPGDAGFLVSPTTLEDPSFPATDQRRYVDPLTVASAVIPSGRQPREFLRSLGVVPGTFGVAWRSNPGVAVPFLVTDLGPRIGEGSPALARRLAGLQPKADLSRSERFIGQVGTPDVTWVFFGGTVMPPPYSAATVEPVAQRAFEAWGGLDRVKACAATLTPH